jgi:uncharacterized protein (TIGR02099 family)
MTLPGRLAVAPVPHRPMTVSTTPLSHRLAGALLGVVFVGLCGVAIAYLAVRHVLWPRVDEFRPRLVALLERELDRPVEIGTLQPRWEGGHPSVSVAGVRIGGPEGEPAFRVESAYARLSWRSLLQLRPRLAELTLQSPSVIVERLSTDRFSVAGFQVSTAGAPGDGAALDRLLEQGRIAVRDAAVRVHDRTGAVAPIRWEGVDLELETSGRRHRARLVVARADDAARSVQAVSEVYRPAFSRPSDWRRWQGEAHLSGDGLSLQRLAAIATSVGAPLPRPVASASGGVDAMLWVGFADAAVNEATLKLRAGDLAADLAHGRLALAAVDGEVQWRRQPDGTHEVRMIGVSAADPSGFSLVADGQIALVLEPTGALRRATLRLPAFDAAAARAAALRLPLPEPERQALAGVTVTGRVRRLDLDWGVAASDRSPLRPADRSVDAGLAMPQAPRLHWRAVFERLSLAHGPGSPPRPAFSNLSGTVEGSEQEGTLVVSGRQSVLVFPGVFDEPAIPFEQIAAEVRWQRAALPDGLQVDVSRLSFSNADTRGQASGRWQAGGRGPAGTLALSGRLERIDARRVGRYLPRALPEYARTWVSGAVPAGIAENVEIEVRGDLADFPFPAGTEGRFRIAAAMREATLDYANDWPRIERIRGDLVFEGMGFEIRAQTGLVEGVRLSEVRARLPDYVAGLLTIEGRGAGQAQDMIRFVDRSPLAATVSTYTRDVKVGGDARLALRLTLPLWALAGTRVAGSVDFPGNEVSLDTTLPPFSAVTGRLEFDERGLSLPGLQGSLLGGPIRVEGRRMGDGRMRIDARGSIDAAGMRQLVDNPLTRRLDGRTDYRAVVEVDHRASSLQLESDLVGLSSDLPAPFGKPAAQPWPLKVVSRPRAAAGPQDRPPGDRLEVRLRDDIALALERDRDPKSERLLIRRAGFALGAQPVVRDSGLSVLVRARAIDLDAWRAVLGASELEQIERSARAGGSVAMPLVPDLVSVVADDVRIAGRDLHEVVVGASRAGGRWRANIASREIDGHFEWRDARPGEPIGTLTARFARLELPPGREGEVESVLSTPPARLPGLDVSAEQLVLGGLPLGRMSLSATNGGTASRPVWALDRLVVAHPAGRLEARGSWALGAGAERLGAGAKVGDERSTGLDFTLSIGDAGRLLAGVGLEDVVRGGTGTLAGAVAWRGSPLAIHYPSLDGRLRLDLGKGAFLKVDPGAAKLIGVLNMQSLPRRLSGDFRDLFGEGFAFDTIDGQARIERGIARTDDLRMRGVQAQVTIRGEADIQRETQRLNVEVVPELNAGLASLAFGAMVNPVIGLGSFAAQYVLRKPLQQVLAYDIDVTGSWSEPTVSERNRRVVTLPDTPSP